MCNTKHIWATTISTEQYHWEQIWVAAAWLEDVVMQEVQVDVNGLPKLQVHDDKMEAT